MRFQHTKAFTLIEMVIVVGIVLLLTGTSIAAYSVFSQSKKLDEQADKIVDVLELAKKKALTGDSTSLSSCSNGASAVYGGYAVSFSSSVYPLNLCCDTTCSTTNQVQNYQVASNTTVTSSPATISFKPLTGELGIGGTASVKVQIDTDCYYITVSQVGIIDKGQKYSGC